RSLSSVSAISTAGVQAIISPSAVGGTNSPNAQRRSRSWSSSMARHGASSNGRVRPRSTAMHPPRGVWWSDERSGRGGGQGTGRTGRRVPQTPGAFQSCTGGRWRRGAGHTACASAGRGWTADRREWTDAQTAGHHDDGRGERAVGGNAARGRGSARRAAGLGRAGRGGRARRRRDHGDGPGEVRVAGGRAARAAAGAGRAGGG